MRRASNRNVMAWTFMGNTRMHQVLREKGNKLSHVGVFTFEVSADGTISETGTAVSTILPYVKKWPHIKWLLTIMNHGTASIFTALRENTNGAQDTFLSEIVRIIDKYPWCSGIDIDLERGGELANRTKANALFSRIYSTVKAKGSKPSCKYLPSGYDQCWRFGWRRELVRVCRFGCILRHSSNHELWYELGGFSTGTGISEKLA